MFSFTLNSALGNYVYEVVPTSKPRVLEVNWGPETVGVYLKREYRRVRKVSGEIVFKHVDQPSCWASQDLADKLEEAYQTLIQAK